MISVLIILSLLISHSTSSTCNCVEIGCITRSSQGEAWVTARGDTFLDPTILSTHFIADIINDDEKIYKYKIQWFSGSWGGWYFPGVNDNEWGAKSDDNVWNQAHKDAGRRAWTMFADHTHEVCYLMNETSTVLPTSKICDCGEGVEISCTTRSFQGEAWVTARGDAFLDPTILSTHFIADIINDNMKIYNYKIQWFSGSWSGWYFPGVNDNEWGAKSDDNVWNQAHKDAGRRSWTSFADHTHEVCYLMNETPDTISATTSEVLSNPNKANHYKILVGIGFLMRMLIVSCM